MSEESPHSQSGEIGRTATPRRAPAEVRQAEPLFDALPESIVVIDAKGHFTQVSAGITHRPGNNLREMLTGIHPEDRERVGTLVARCLEKGSNDRGIFRTPDPVTSSGWRSHEFSVSNLVDEDGNQRAVLLSRDVSNRIAEDNRQREDEFRYRDLAENASDLLVEIDSDGRILYISPNSEKLTGRPASEIIGTTLARFQHHWFGLDGVGPDDEGMTIVEGLQKTLAHGGGQLMRFRFNHPDGSDRQFEMRARSFTREDGAIHVVAIARDVSERVRAEEELRESEERYRIVSTITNDVITEMTDDGRLAFVSPTVEQVLGYTPESLVGSQPWKLLHPDDAERVQATFGNVAESGLPAVVFSPYRSRHSDGSWRWLESSGFTYESRDGETRMLVVSRDITERKEQENRQQALEEQVRQAQKLEGLGVMAGGIAHDFNNFLTPILGEAGLGLEDLPENSALRPRLEKIQAAARRAALLTSQMLAYAGKKTLAMSPIDLSKLVAEMSQLMASGIAKTVYVDEDLPEDLPLIEGDPAQLTQVVMNLITNASEAVGQGDGAIAIRTGLLHSDELDARRLVLGDSQLAPGDYVFLEVRDTGRGMSPATQARIFDPFFTTKFAGRGLGLAAVLGIVRGHRGAIEINSGPTRGTSFRVVFPATDMVAEVPPKTLPKPLDWAGTGTVLIVDDDESVLELAQETLERCGLKVLTAPNGDSGVIAFAKQPEAIDAVLLDRTMPGLSGGETVAELRRLRPDVRIVLASGYSEERAAIDFRSDDLAGFLQKPFLPEELAQKIREAIEG